jgi:hypothetical protein
MGRVHPGIIAEFRERAPCGQPGPRTGSSGVRMEAGRGASLLVSVTLLGMTRSSGCPEWRPGVSRLLGRRPPGRPVHAVRVCRWLPWEALVASPCGGGTFAMPGLARGRAKSVPGEGCAQKRVDDPGSSVRPGPQRATGGARRCSPAPGALTDPKFRLDSSCHHVGHISRTPNRSRRTRSQDSFALYAARRLPILWAREGTGQVQESSARHPRMSRESIPRVPGGVRRLQRASGFASRRCAFQRPHCHSRGGAYRWQRGRYQAQIRQPPIVDPQRSCHQPHNGG